MNSSLGIRPRGFSLIEMVVAIVIMSIIAIGLVEFITNSSQGYVQTAARNQVSSAGRIVIDRIAMELRNALPESVRISPYPNPHPTTNLDAYEGDQCLEFIPVKAATTYIDPAIRPAAHKLAFDVVDFVPNQEGETGVYAVIYPTSSAQIYESDFNGTGGGTPKATDAVARVDVTDNDMDIANTATLTYSRLANDAPYEHRFRRASSVERVFLTEQPVSYCITGSKLYRYSGYGFHAVQKLPEKNGYCAAGAVPGDCLPATTPKRVLITDQVDNSALNGGMNGQAFDVFESSRQRNAIIQIEMNFSLGGQQIRLNHEVLQQITP